MSTLQLLLAHEFALPRTALRLLLERDIGVEVIAEADTAERVHEQLRIHHPDLILITLSQRAKLGSSLVESLHQKYPKVRIIIISSRDELPFARLLMTSGATGYVCEHSPVAELQRALHEVALDHRYIDSSVSDQADAVTLGKLKATGSRKRPHGFLSKRETEVLTMLAQGFTNQQVADALDLSVKTAETYRVRLTRKLGVKSRSELFRYAFEVGMVGSDQLVG